VEVTCLQAGWFPTYTLTEDYALGIELKKQRFQCRYVRDYLALGDRPSQASADQQRRTPYQALERSSELTSPTLLMLQPI